MSIRDLKASIAAIAGEVEGVRTALPRMEATIDASLLPVFMPGPFNGGLPGADLPAPSRPFVGVLRFYLAVGTETDDFAEAMELTDELAQAVQRRIYTAWAVQPRHPLMRYVRRINEVTVSTELTVPIGGVQFIGAEFGVFLQEETRVQ